MRGCGAGKSGYVRPLADAVDEYRLLGALEIAAGALFLVAGVVVNDPAEAVVGWLFIACFYGGGMYALL
jgi:hypothetical protein